MLFTARDGEWFVIMFSKDAESVSGFLQDFYGSEYGQCSVTPSTIEEVTEFIKRGGEIFK